mgnify:CR=1 FL=1
MSDGLEAGHPAHHGVNAGGAGGDLLPVLAGGGDGVHPQGGLGDPDALGGLQDDGGALVAEERQLREVLPAGEDDQGPAVLTGPDAPDLRRQVVRQTVLTPESLDTLTPSALSALTADSAVSSNVGKLITSDRWYYAAALPDEADYPSE